MTPINLMTDNRLFGARFGGPTFATWLDVIRAAWGCAASAADRSVLERLTGRSEFPTQPVRELWVVVGRRGGKSLIAALLAVFLACFQKYSLAPGERGVVMVIAADRRQARVVKRYISGLLHSVPMLQRLISKETRSSIQLTNAIDVEIHTSSRVSVRGYTVVAALLDEIAFWPTDDAADSDAEILNALRPAMATIPNALLIAISSPYARRGELWRTYNESFGQPNDDVLVVKAPTWVMNPTVPRDRGVVAKAYADDDAVASAEYGAEFRRDIESFVSREVLEAATVTGRFELPYLRDQNYVAFVDPSGGAADSFTLAIAHRENERGVLDVLREVKPPFSPEQVITEYAALLQTYRIFRVTGDRYAGEFPREQFRKRDIAYELSDRAKSDIYRDVLPLLNSGRVELLDHPRLYTQLANLERRTARGGKDSIDHAPKHHDDAANAACGALLLAAQDREPLICE
jgi:hypothetical protein